MENPVIINRITLTNPTQVKTGYGENDLAALLKDPKWANNNDLTVKVEFTQKREPQQQQPSGKRRASLYSVQDTLEGHSKVITDRTRYFWINAMTLTALKKEGFVEGADFGQLKGVVAFLLTEEYTEAQFRDNHIITSPKRKGRDGDILLSKDGALIFQDTQLVTNASDEEFENFTYQDFVNYELASKIELGIEVISASEVPEESRTNGFFNPEFEEWLVEEYTNRNQKVLKEVA